MKKRSTHFNPLESRRKEGPAPWAARFLPVLFAGLLLFPLLSHSQSKNRVTINARGNTVAEVFSMIEKQTDKSFTYNNEQVAALPRVTFKVTDEEIPVVVDLCLKSSNLEWTLVGNTYVIRMKTQVRQTSVPVAGTVTGEDGLPMAGVNVMIRNTHTGVTTDLNGKYTITVPSPQSAELEFSFLGMTKIIEKIGERRVIDVTMKATAESIRDVVVTGYSNISRSSFTGSSVTVTGEELQRITSRNPIDALQVFDPSFRIMTNNEMGSNINSLPDITIRGQSGIGNLELNPMEYRNNPNAPVFILDGFEITIEKVYDMDLTRIASMTILKDAAATAIYGSRAANGVVIIESVTPKPGKFNVNYNLVMTVTAPDLSSYNLMNSREKIMAEEAAGFYEFTPTMDDGARNTLELERLRKWDRVNRGVDTYWLSQPLQTALNHKHSIYLEGGSDNIRFGVDLRYDDQKGVMKGSKRDKAGAGFFVDYTFRGLQIRNYVTYDDIRSAESPYGSFSTFATKLPYDLFKDENGEYVQKLQQEYEKDGWHAPPGDLVNPLYEAKKMNNFNKSNYNELINNLSVRWAITGNLQLRGQLALSRKNSSSRNFTDPLSGREVGSDNPGTLRLSDNRETQINSNFFLNYVSVLGKNHINSSVGINTVERLTDRKSSVYKGFPSGELNSPQYARIQESKTSFDDNHTRLFGSFLSANYTYDDIYLADLSVRLDGSSEFGSDKKYAPFWSGGLGMNIHNLDIMKRNAAILSTLKIRGTYGQVGKVNFPPYTAKNSYRILEEWYDTGSGVILEYYGNDKLKWEITDETNLGINLGFLNNRILLNFDYYNRVTKDLITRVTIPSSTGFMFYMDNMGKVRNRGIEIHLNAQVISTKDLNVMIYANMGRNRGKIMKISESMKEYNDLVDQHFAASNASGPALRDLKYTKPVLKYQEGGSLTSIYGMKSLGIDPADGEEIFLRQDGTITRTWDSFEQQIIGDTEPNARGSFGVNAQWKGFFLYASLMYEFGGDLYNTTLVDKIESVNLYNDNADRRVLYDRWQNPGDNARYKKIQMNNQATKPTSRFVQKNNTVRFNSLTVGYDFKQKWVTDAGFGMLRMQAGMKDVAYMSNIRQERGLSYPYARVFDFTLNISF